MRSQSLLKKKYINSILRTIQNFQIKTLDAIEQIVLQ